MNSKLNAEELEYELDHAIDPEEPIVTEAEANVDDKYDVRKMVLDDDVDIDSDDTEEDSELTKSLVDDEEDIPTSAKRLPEENLEQYHERLKKLKKRNRMSKMFATYHDETRFIKRAKSKRFNVRLTKPLKKVRKKWFMGEHDVTNVIKNKGDVQAYLKEQAINAREIQDVLDEETGSKSYLSAKKPKYKMGG